MTTLQVQTQLSLDDLLNGLQQLPLDDLERVKRETILLYARQVTPNLPQVEADLLFNISQGIVPETTRTRCTKLTQKARQEGLTDAEQTELEALIDEIELLNAERMAHLVQLAQLRQLPLDQLMSELEIEPLSYE